MAEHEGKFTEVAAKLRTSRSPAEPAEAADGSAEAQASAVVSQLVTEEAPMTDITELSGARV